jgi:hypothetical protein
MRGVALFILASSLAWSRIPGTARADCVSACQASTYCDSRMNASGECGRRLNDCYINECGKRLYGSIAYGWQSGAVGWAYDFDDAPAAEREALRNCGANGNDCEIVVDFWNSCAAVAADGGTVAFGLGDDRRQAEGAAILACGEDGGANCLVQAWSCTGN